MKDYKEFTLTDDHVTLLRELNVEIVPGYGPMLNQKRLYHNGDVEMDIAGLLGWELFEDADEEKHLSRAQYDAARRIHAEVSIALQIVLRTSGFTPGLYRTVGLYDVDWRPVVPDETP